MRILFLTDSLSLPRGEKEEFVKYEDTYVNQTKAEFTEHLIADSTIGGATILMTIRSRSMWSGICANP